MKKFIESLKSGGLPTPTGLSFTRRQSEEIKSILDERKGKIDRYFECVVKPRVKAI